MNSKLSFLLIISSFVLGLFLGGQIILFDGSAYSNTVAGLEVAVPQDRVVEDQIKVMEDEIIITVPDASWATFTDTHSMDPILFKGANALQVEPQNSEDIKEGDIISYVPKDGTERLIIHRVVYIGEDEEGIYYIVKGDNNKVSDPGKVRFNQVKKVLFAVIY